MTMLSTTTHDNTIDGIDTYTETYVGTSAGAAGVPAFGTRAPAGIDRNLRVRHINRENYGRHVDKHKWVVRYMPPHLGVPQSFAFTETEPFPDLPRTWSLGVEAQQIAENNWVWKSDLNQVKQPIFKMIILGLLTVDKIHTDEGFWKSSKAVLGHINVGPFLDSETGTLLFTGIQANEFWRSGDKKYFVRYNFRYRSVTGGVASENAPQDDGWNYVYRPDRGWDVPTLSETSEDYLYDTAALDAALGIQ